jgi:hypothetical protein
MSKKFYIISTSLLLLHLDGTHILSNRKLAKGFEQNGYEIIEILNDTDINIIENNIGNIIILSNFMDFENDWDKIVDFGKRFDNLFYILWCWHYIPNIPFKYWTYTFQEFKLEPIVDKFKIEYHLYKKLELEKKFIPYRFSSYVDPNSNFKELNSVEKIYDIVYIGSAYEVDKLILIKENNKYKSFIHIVCGGPNSITGKDFEDIYRKSKICLGFMAKDNNDSNTITERIWEAFSFGCLVITNSKASEIVTNNVTICYETTDDLLNKIDYYLENEEERLKKIEEGYNIFTSYGNYKNNAREFINLMNYKINSN